MNKPNEGNKRNEAMSVSIELHDLKLLLEDLFEDKTLDDILESNNSSVASVIPILCSWNSHDRIAKVLVFSEVLENNEAENRFNEDWFYKYIEWLLFTELEQETIKMINDGLSKKAISIHYWVTQTAISNRLVKIKNKQKAFRDRDPEKCLMLIDLRLQHIFNDMSLVEALHTPKNELWKTPNVWSKSLDFLHSLWRFFVSKPLIKSCKITINPNNAHIKRRIALYDDEKIIIDMLEEWKTWKEIASSFWLRVNQIAWRIWIAKKKHKAQLDPNPTNILSIDHKWIVMKIEEKFIAVDDVIQQLMDNDLLSVSKNTWLRVNDLRIIYNIFINE